MDLKGLFQGKPVHVNPPEDVRLERDICRSQRLKLKLDELYQRGLDTDKARERYNSLKREYDYRIARIKYKAGG